MTEPYCSFEVGQRVTPISETLPGGVNGETIPVFGRVYTIREVLILLGVPCIRLREIVNKPQLYCIGEMECAFPAESFTPVRTTSTDAGMAILRKIDADVFQNERVPV
jgi:hypothetical protein